VELDRCDWRHVNRFVVDYLRRDGLLHIIIIIIIITGVLDEP